MGLADRDYMRSDRGGKTAPPRRPQGPTLKQRFQFLWWRIKRWFR